MKSRVTIFSLAVILVMGIFASITMARMSRTYEGQNAAVSVYDLQQDPDSYDDSKADGAAAAIVQQNLAKSHAVNDVTSIVFDFRGYDTMGEAFILVTAVTGSAVILFTKKTGKEDSQDEQ